MTHEKLVTGTESPTRYTKVIRNPGAGTKYNQTYQETDYVSRYTKTVTVPASYFPEPPPPDPEPEKPIAKDQTQFSELNVYEVGQTIEAFAGTWRKGNTDNQTYRSRWQYRATADDPWESTSWENHINQQVKFTKVIDKVGIHRFNTQVRDSSFDPIYQVNSFSQSKTATDPVILSTEIGETSVTVNDMPHTGDAPLTLLMNDPVPVVVSITGDANPTYTWGARNDYPLMVGGTGSSVVLTFPEAGVSNVTCTIIDNTATDSPKSHAINFYIVDAKTYEELKNKGEI